LAQIHYITHFIEETEIQWNYLSIWTKVIQCVIIFNQLLISIQISHIEFEFVRIWKHFRWKVISCIICELVQIYIIDKYVLIIDLAYSLCCIVNELVIIRDYRFTITTIVFIIFFTTIQTSPILCFVIFKSIIFNSHYSYVFRINAWWIMWSRIVCEIVIWYFSWWITNDILISSFFKFSNQLRIHCLPTFNINASSLLTNIVNEIVTLYFQQTWVQW